MTTIPKNSPEYREMYFEFFGVRRSERYHRKRRGFYSALAKSVAWATTFAGSGALASVLAELPGIVVVVLTAFIAAVSLAAVIGDFNGKAQLHQELLDAFTDLESEICSRGWDQQLLATVRRKRGSLQKREPSILRVLDAMCHNEQARAEGCDPGQSAIVMWWQAVLAHLFDVLPSRLKRRDQAS